MKHPTPGPWRIDPSHSLCIESAHGNIALVNLARASEADAQLIADAPAMRIALRWMLAKFAGQMADGPLDEPPVEARAVIEKLLGESDQGEAHV